MNAFQWLALDLEWNTWKALVKKFFTVSADWNSVAWTWNKQRCSIKEASGKTSQNAQLKTRSSLPMVFCQKIILKILAKFRRSIFSGVSFLIKLQAEDLKLSQAFTEDVL